MAGQQSMYRDIKKFRSNSGNVQGGRLAAKNERPATISPERDDKGVVAGKHPMAGQ
jgi:hypothetical protein